LSEYATCYSEGIIEGIKLHRQIDAFTTEFIGKVKGGSTQGRDGSLV